MKDIFARELYNKLYNQCSKEEQELVLKRLYEYVH
jgi:hypothetical protein